MPQYSGEQVVYLCLKDNLSDLESKMAVQINNVITKCLQKLLSFVLVVVTKYKAQIQTEMLKDLRQTSRDTDMLLKQ